MPDDTTSPVAAEGRDRIGEERIAHIRANCICDRDVPAAEVEWLPDCPIHGQPPVAAEGLRERLAEVIDSEHNPLEPLDAGRLADAVIAALAGDSDPDLPARMAEAMRAARDQWVSPEGELAHPEVGEHFAAAAMGVRDEHLAAALARLTHALGELSSLRDHRARWGLEKARADKAEEQLREERNRNRVAAEKDVCPGCMQREEQRDAAWETSRQNGVKYEQTKQAWHREQDRADKAEAEVERLQAELAEIKRVTDPPADDSADLPADPAEARELWDFGNRQLRWQHHMAAKFSDQVQRLRAELAEAWLRVNELSKKEDQQYRRAEKAEAERDRWKEAHDDLDSLISEERKQHETTLAELAALKAAIETGSVARFAADVLSLVDDYSDRERSIIARLPFLATFDQVCFEKYGINTDQIAALAASESPGDAPAKPKHIGGRANAEDCPACTGDLPYPWICPGEPETPGDAETDYGHVPGCPSGSQFLGDDRACRCWPTGAARTPGDAEEATDE